MSETNLQAFVRALSAAYDASSAVDHFDLRSEDDESVRKWNRLLERQRAAFREMHETCQRVPVADLLD